MPAATAGHPLRRTAASDVTAYSVLALPVSTVFHPCLPSLLSLLPASPSPPTTLYSALAVWKPFAPAWKKPMLGCAI
eukprot:4421524-Pyramimonas_sp.AAC.1